MWGATSRRHRYFLLLLCDTGPDSALDPGCFLNETVCGSLQLLEVLVDCESARLLWICDSNCVSCLRAQTPPCSLSLYHCACAVHIPCCVVSLPPTSLAASSMHPLCFGALAAVIARWCVMCVTPSSIYVCACSLVCQVLSHSCIYTWELLHPLRFIARC